MAGTEYEIGYCGGCDRDGVIIETTSELCGPCHATGRAEFDDRDIELAQLREQLAEVDQLAQTLREVRQDMQRELAEERAKLDAVGHSLRLCQESRNPLVEERDTLRAELNTLRNETPTVEQHLRDPEFRRIYAEEMAKTDNEELRAELADYRNSLKHALDGHEDEEHCGCCAMLRADNGRLQALLESVNDEVCWSRLRQGTHRIEPTDAEPEGGEGYALKNTQPIENTGVGYDLKSTEGGDP